MSNIDKPNLNTESIAGQLVMPRIDFNSGSYLETAARFVKEFKVAGFIVFNGNMDQVAETVKKLQELSEKPLLFGIDAERGVGQIIGGGTRFPFLMSQGAVNDEELLRLQADITAQEMKKCGLNLLFAPVLDVNTNRDNPIVNIRAFGDDPHQVARMGSIYAKQVMKHGILTCGKHFPGHGSTDTDSHVELPVLNKNINELKKLELVPFEKVIESGIDFIMVGHLSVKTGQSEAEPSTISKQLVSGLLKNQLRFSNIAITDSFRMDALKSIGNECDVAVRSVEAGIDIILDPLDAESLIDRFRKKINVDETFYSNAKESAVRILEIKRGIIAGLDEIPGINNPEKTVTRIARKSVCRIKGKALSGKKVDVNVLDVTEGGRDICKPFIDRITSNGMKINRVEYITDKYDFNTSYENDTLTLVITTVSAWTRKSVLTGFFKKILRHIGDNCANKIVVFFGSPYFITDFLDYTIVLSVFDSILPCQLAAADLLTGEYDSDSKLPIKI